MAGHLGYQCCVNRLYSKKEGFGITVGNAWKRDWRGGKWEEQKGFWDFCRRESVWMYNVNLSVILKG